MKNVLHKYGSKMVKRSSIRFKGGATFLCNKCGFACKSSIALSKHTENEYAISFNASPDVLRPRQSTGNNSLVENMMILVSRSISSAR